MGKRFDDGRACRNCFYCEIDDNTIGWIQMDPISGERIKFYYKDHPEVGYCNYPKDVDEDLLVGFHNAPNHYICHRYPPNHSYKDLGDNFPNFPFTAPANSCGEFKFYKGSWYKRLWQFLVDCYTLRKRNKERNS